MNRASRVAALLLALASPDGSSPVPAEAMPEDTSSPDHVVGDGTPASCTGAAFVAAVAQGVRVTVDADS